MEQVRVARKAAAIRAVNINDLRTLAQKRLPRAVFDFLDGAADDEVTLAANRSAFKALTFRPRQAVTFPECNLRTNVLGFDLSFPVMLAPVGCSRVIHHEGETGVARAAGEGGIIYVLSTASGHRLEDVKAASSAPLWYQLYLLGGRGPSEAVIDRAQNVGYSALVLTIDTAVAGMRERDVRNRLADLAGKSILAKIPLMPNLLMHPRWLMGFLRDGGAPILPNVIIPGQGPLPLLNVAAALARAMVTWEDFKWIREIWHGPIVRRCATRRGSRGCGRSGFESRRTSA